MKVNQSRRSFLQKSLLAGAGLSLIDPISLQAMMKKSKMKLGLVTYQWGKDWDLPTLIANCEKTGFLGVELELNPKDLIFRINPSLKICFTIPSFISSTFSLPKYSTMFPCLLSCAEPDNAQESIIT